jgi:hypothetical protein
MEIVTFRGYTSQMMIDQINVDPSLVKALFILLVNKYNFVILTQG